MAKLLYSVTMSLDGFIAGPDGDMSWLARHLGPDPMIDELIGDVGALLVGNRTYGGDDPNRGDPEHEGAFSGQWHGAQFVLTHNPPERPVPGVAFLDNLGEAVAAARAAAGERYVNVLGADVARQCLAAGELDEVLAIIAPVLLGDGTPLFHHPGGTDVPLERIRCEQTPQSVAVWYRVKAG